MNKYREAQKREAAKRVTKMKRLRAKGWTLQQIATEYGISRQRVYQLLAEKYDDVVIVEGVES